MTIYNYEKLIQLFFVDILSYDEYNISRFPLHLHRDIAYLHSFNDRSAFCSGVLNHPVNKLRSQN